jgi:hypothetical protein
MSIRRATKDSNSNGVDPTGSALKMVLNLDHPRVHNPKDSNVILAEMVTRNFAIV